MNKCVLLDANILILAFDTALQDDDQKSQLTLQQQRQAEEILEKLISDPDVQIAITPLIRYEVLRGVKNIPLEDMQEILDGIEHFEIMNDDSNFASKIFRLGKYGEKGKNINKRNFDIFHYSVARNNQLEWKTLDSDFSKIEKIDELVKQAENDNIL